MKIPYSSHPVFQLLLAAGAIASIVKLMVYPGDNENMRWFVIFVAAMILIRSIYMILAQLRNRE